MISIDKTNLSYANSVRNSGISCIMLTVSYANIKWIARAVKTVKAVKCDVIYVPPKRVRTGWGLQLIS
jgi:hypothetical protein